MDNLMDCIYIGVGDIDFDFEKYRHLFPDHISDSIPSNEFYLDNSGIRMNTIARYIHPGLECFVLGNTQAPQAANVWETSRYFGHVILFNQYDYDLRFPYELIEYYKNVLKNFFGEEIAPFIMVGLGSRVHEEF